MTSSRTLSSTGDIRGSVSVMERPGGVWAIVARSILALLAGVFVAGAVATWTADSVSSGACTLASAGCIAARASAVGLGAAVLFGSVVLAVVLPRRVGLAWSALLALVAIL